MYANKIAVGDHVTVDLYPFIRKYEDGHVERFVRSSFVPASDHPAASGVVATRDVVVDHATGVSVRMFLPSDAAATGRRLPVVMYVHGRSFCTESAFSRTYHRYAASLAAHAGVLIVSLEYRLAPEHPIPAAYDDAWAALRWVATASLSDPWLSAHADRSRVFLAGDSVGGNIVYHTAVRASHDDRNSVDVEGVVLVQPYFWGAERLPCEEAWDGVAMFTPELVDRLWPFVTAGQAGNDDPRIDPPDEEIASLKCRRMESIVQFINQPTTSPPPPLPRDAIHSTTKSSRPDTPCKGILASNVSRLTTRPPKTARTGYMLLKPSRAIKDPLAVTIHGSYIIMNFF